MITLHENQEEITAVIDKSFAAYLIFFLSAVG